MLVRARARTRAIACAALLTCVAVGLAPALRAAPSPVCLATEGNACLLVDGPPARDLHAFLRACDWVALPPDDAFEDLAWLDIVVNGSHMRGALPYDAPDDAVRLDPRTRGAQGCRPPAMSAGHQWTAVRFGPFDTRGGSFWPSWFAQFADGPRAPWAAHAIGVARGGRSLRHYAFDAYAVGSLDASGVRLVGFPPLHQHHFHFGSWSEPLWLDRARTERIPPEIAGTHGENQCRAEEGGVDCFVRAAPRGAAFVERAPLAAGNSVLDVRPLGSPPMRSWQVVAARALPAGAPPPRARVSLVYVMTRPSPHASRGTYVLATGDARPSVTWDAKRVPQLREGVPLVEAYMHAHADLVYDAWLFAGAPADVFAGNASDVAASFRRIDYTRGGTERAMESIRARRVHGAASVARLLCSYMTNGYREWLPATDGAAPEPFQRKARCPVVPLRYVADGGGADFVIITFHAPPLGYPIALTRAHAYVKLFYLAPLAQAYVSDFY